MAQATAPLPQQASQPRDDAPKYRRPEIGDDVHYFDETRERHPGPFAAKVVAHGHGGVTLAIFTAQGIFNPDRVPHKAVLEKGPGRKKWWQWPNETRRDAEAAAAASAEASKQK